MKRCVVCVERPVSKAHGEWLDFCVPCRRAWHAALNRCDVVNAIEWVARRARRFERRRTKR